MNDEELLEIVRTGVERRNCDYKAPKAWDETDKKSCCQLVKDILALANSGGGSLVIGVDDDTKQAVGLTDPQVRSFEVTRVSQFVNQYASPPVHLTIRRVTDRGKTCVLIQVALFSTTPHICQKDFPGVLERAALYVRTANKESARVTDPHDMSAVIEGAVRRRADTLLREIEVVLRGGGHQRPRAADDHGFLREAVDAQGRFAELVSERGWAFPSEAGFEEVLCHPRVFRQGRFSLPSMRPALGDAVRGVRASWLGHLSHDAGITYATPDGIETFFNRRLGDDGVEFWQCRASGLFFQRSRMAEDFYGPEKGYAHPIMSIWRMLYRVADAAGFVGNLHGALACEADEPVRLRIVVSGCRHRKLVSFKFDCPLGDTYVCRVDTVRVERWLTVPEWKARRTPLSVEIAQEILRQFNCDRVADDTLAEEIEKYVSGRS
jgi:hypothetical protein